MSSALAFIGVTSRRGCGHQDGLFEACAAGDEVGDRGVLGTADRSEEGMLKGGGKQLGLQPARIELHGC
ncbi:hypothetical protein D3C76_1821730 [compost metagenome]